MFIRRTQTNNSATGERYFTHRLVRTERVQGKVRQVTLLNLGRHFPIDQGDWPLLCLRVEQILSNQPEFFVTECPEAIERLAKNYALRLIEQSPAATPTTQATQAPTSANSATSSATSSATPAQDFQEVDIESLKQLQPRSVGVEHVGLYALSQLGIVDHLTALGVNGVMRGAIIGSIIGRMAHPASEWATWDWLKTRSALGELIDYDFGTMPHTRLYRASDELMAHRQALENRVFCSVQTLFALEETVALYDLTNTYFQGGMAGNAKAKRGRSKEKRSDCPLITLGLVLDRSGFVRRSQSFEGNVSEGGTLAGMLSGLGAPVGALVILDAGIATEDNIAWLVKNGYRYLAVRRGGARQFDEAQSISIETASGDPLKLQKVVSEDGKEVCIYCHSPGREKKELGMLERFGQQFENALQKIAEGLTKPRSEKKHDKILERIGRLKQKSHGASQHYTIRLATDESGKIVTGLTWEKIPVAGTMATHPGVYCLRSSETAWSEETLWRTYTMLTDLESVFRSLKSELGLRPIFHSKEDRADGHLFITVLAYQCVQVIRRKLKHAGIHDSWASLREILLGQCRITASFQRKNGGTLNVRKSSLAEPDLLKIYRALGINPAPGGTKKLFA